MDLVFEFQLQAEECHLFYVLDFQLSRSLEQPVFAFIVDNNNMI